MAATIPMALRHADIARFAQRAGQLEKAKPVVAYWCNYWIVNQILSKGLHNSDDESMTYTMHLMDNLEQSKADHRDNDAIVDDLAGRAYVEQFGTETLSRAENAMKLNKATRQTADTFLASATFLELCQIWGPQDPEVASKIKYAKYHAVRIARAIKAGEDPNLSNPAPIEPSALAQSSTELEGRDGVQAPKSVDETEDRGRSTIYQPLIEDAPNEQNLLQPRLERHSVADEGLHPPRNPSTSKLPSPDNSSEFRPLATEATENYPNRLGNNEAAPFELPPASNNATDETGYFPKLPGSDGVGKTPLGSRETNRNEPGSPPAIDLSMSSVATALHTPTTSKTHPPDTPPAISLQSFPPPDMDRSTPPEPPPALFPSYPTQAPYSSRNQPQPTQFSLQQAPPPSSPQGNVRPPPPSIPSVNSRQTYQATYLSDEEAVLKAQKHARWAISALNFEDVNTAVKELREALESLGAR